MAEYNVIDDLLAGDVRPAQLLIEFHERFEHAGVALTRESIAKLRAAGYRIYAISDLYWEMSFIHKSAL